MVAPLGFSPSEWDALGTMLLGVGVVIGAAWGLASHRRMRDNESARWLHGVFRDVYLGERFTALRRRIEYDYEAAVRPLIEARMRDDPARSPEDVEFLSDLDTLLAYLEHVLRLEDEAHVSRRDRWSVFQLWFGVLTDPNRPALRDYAAWRGFDHLGAALASFPTEELGPRPTLLANLIAMGAEQDDRRDELSGPTTRSRPRPEPTP